MEDWKINDCDETEDKLPPFPNDWVDQEKDFTLDEKIDILISIRNAGNHFFNNQNFVEASRKYKKVTRYYNFFEDKTKNWDDKDKLRQYHLLNLLNFAASELKMRNFEEVCMACNEVLQYDSNNSKAYYRRGQALTELKNYELAIDDFKRAHQLVPESKSILVEFERAKKLLMDYRKIEKQHYVKMFQ